MGELETLLGAGEKTIGVNATMFEVGLTSVDLLKLKRQIEAPLHLDEIPLITMMKHPSVRDLANALQGSNAQTAYNPVVQLGSQGSKTPLWLIHPGVGEILVFLNLAKFIVDRPVYALRARGFNPGETHFKDIPECVATYYAAVKEVQPCGPYAIAGYSYGSMLALEVAKVLEQQGDEVRFVGCFNLPHAYQISHASVVVPSPPILHSRYHLRGPCAGYRPCYRGSGSSRGSRVYYQRVVRYACHRAISDGGEVGKRAALAFGLQSMANHYEPEGKVTHMDVFYRNPLPVVASSKEQWLEDHLQKWKDFVKEEVRYHDVDGHHYTMLSPAHVRSFQARLRRALAARGL
jgi:thioesterase domain-containing protein